MPDTYAATKWYECPLCLETDIEEEFAEYEVTIFVDPGSPAVMYPTHRAHPAEPPSIDEWHITDGNVFGCPHSEEEVCYALDDQVHEDFHDNRFTLAGPVEPDHPDI